MNFIEKQKEFQDFKSKVTTQKIKEIEKKEEETPKLYFQKK